MINRETKVVHTTDRFMKVIITVIALCLVWLSVKDTRLEPGVTLEAQFPSTINLNVRTPAYFDIRHRGSIRN